jgi:broad-specificity NMP kinase
MACDRRARWQTVPEGVSRVRPKLILISGAPGVGKSEVASRLYKMLEECAWLDGDDVWRVHPFRVDAERVALAERNVMAVLHNYLSSGCAHVILTWVLHRQEIIDRILRGLDDVPFETSVVTLVCDESTLESRRRASHPGDVNVDVALRRQRECAALDSTKIDTSRLTREAVALRVLEAVSAG